MAADSASSVDLKSRAQRPRTKSSTSVAGSAEPELPTDTFDLESSPLLTDRSIPVDSGHLRLTAYALFVGLVVAISSVQFGYHNGELNTPREAITHCDDPAANGVGPYTPDLPTLPRCIPMSDGSFSFATSIFTLGGLVGSVLAPFVADRYGRKTATVANNLTYILGSLAMSLASNLPWLLTGRFLVGVGSGLSIVVNPMYLTEIAPVHWRGTFGLMNQLGIVLGLLFTQTLGYLLNSVPGWRIVLGMGILLSVLQLFLIIFCVESPRYLASRPDGDIKARESLVRLRGTEDVDRELASWQHMSHDLHPEAEPVPVSPLSVTFSDEDAQLLGVNNTASATPPEVTPGTAVSPSTTATPERQRSLGTLAMLRSPHYRKPLLIALLLQAIQQWSGINTVFFYSTVILSTISPGNEGLITVMINVFNLLSTIVAALLVDRLGRRPLLLVSMSGMLISLVVLALSTHFSASIVSLVSVFAIVGTFAVGLGPLSFLLAVELVDTQAAGTVASCGLAANWISNFAVSSLFLLLQKLIGGWTFLIFAGLLGVATTVVYFTVPETKDKDTEEIWRDMGLIK
ncbi:hypothetical protein IWQ60_003122 [Tieghemiomyces parasiticus]|uniref:Major facilitator superfamily (MFS) profile domain-containing protein n=1 Tax=Tieghemiomyces parasiticus TaxID=78921 RepID=A0A9W8AIF6_9FUNG|nr:hypothetical protein IWQ60_003122 [Tieghemiomyces parasiticus]